MYFEIIKLYFFIIVYAEKKIYIYKISIIVLLVNDVFKIL